MLDDAVPLIKALHGIARLELCHHRRGQPEQSKSERIAFERVAINAGPDLGIEGVDPAATCVVVVAVGVVGERNGHKPNMQLEIHCRESPSVKRLNQQIATF